MNWLPIWRTVHHVSVGIGTAAGVGLVIPVPPVQIAAGVLAVVASVISHTTPDK